MQSDCLIADCPIRNDPDNQPGRLWGTSISFAEPSVITQEDRIGKFKEWDAIGVGTIRAGLQRGGTIYIGQRAVNDLAWEWVRSKEREELPISLKPGMWGAGRMWGAGIGLKELWRELERWRGWFKVQRRR
jgi:hypothetical protein